MRIASYVSIFNRRGFWMLLLFAVATIVIWRVGTASPVSAQAKTKVNPKDDLTYVWISPGTFPMGCVFDNSGECQGNELPRHSVTLTSGFWIGQTLVTQAAYKKVAGANQSQFKGDQLPVENVSWDEAKTYCEGVDMRLPTEAEWEYAARGGSAAARYAPLGQIAWYDGNSMGTTHEVGQKQANGYGLYDMLGNVWEWVADWYAPYRTAQNGSCCDDLAEAAVDPKGPTTGLSHVLRGGSWNDFASDVRVELRDRIASGNGDGKRGYDNYSTGFRCAGE